MWMFSIAEINTPVGSTAEEVEHDIISHCNSTDFSRVVKGEWLGMVPDLIFRFKVPEPKGEGL